MPKKHGQCAHPTVPPPHAETSRKTQRKASRTNQSGSHDAAGIPVRSTVPGTRTGTVPGRYKNLYCTITRTGAISLRHAEEHKENDVSTWFRHNRQNIAFFETTLSACLIKPQQAR